MAQKLFDMLQERGFVKDMTHPEQIKELLNSDKKSLFILVSIQRRIVCISDIFLLCVCFDIYKTQGTKVYC